jgi:hypothetical protein
MRPWQRYEAENCPAQRCWLCNGSWVDPAGVLHFADDIYPHNKQMEQKMFTNPQ